MSQKIYVTNIEHKVSEKTGKEFWSLDTNDGRMNTFDKGIADEIFKKGTPNEFDLEIKVSGNFKNVAGITLPEFSQKVETPVANANPVQQTTQAPSVPYVPKPSAESQRFAGMSISYAKDLVVAKAIGHEKLRSEAMAICELYSELVDKLNKK